MQYRLIPLATRLSSLSEIPISYPRIIEDIRYILSEWRRFRLPESEAFFVLVGLESQTDHIPVASFRDSWAPAGLTELDMGWLLFFQENEALLKLNAIKLMNDINQHKDLE